MSVKRFQRRTEDFVCENCNAKVKGGGYTNHCPVCLWSKHVDINPGDRLAECKGLMKPIAVEPSGAEYDILHKCIACGYEKRNRTSSTDDFEEVLRVASQRAHEDML